MRMFHLFGGPFGLARKLYHLARLPAESAVLEEARRRDAVGRFEEAMAAGLSSRAAARAVGVSKSTLYRWRTEGARGKWTADSRRPRRFRGEVKRTRALRQAVKALRREWPGVGKIKLALLLRAAGWQVSVSTVGRVLRELFDGGHLRRAEAGKRRTRLGLGRTARAFAQRWTGPCPAARAGERVQVDTLAVKLFGGRAARLFVAQDMHTRMMSVMAASAATAASGARFLEKMLADFPFRVRSIQADGGGEFRGAFEQACQARALRLVVLPPRSPKLNGRVESLNNAIRRECLNPHPAPVGVEELQGQAGDWADRYNRERPHASLNYRKPVELIPEPEPA